jgi:hypothetical protein
MAASGLNNKLRRIRPVRTSAMLDRAHELATNRATEAADREIDSGTNACACHYP